MPYRHRHLYEDVNFGIAGGRLVPFGVGRIQTVRHSGEQQPFAYLIHIGFDWHIVMIRPILFRVPTTYKSKGLAAKALCASLQRDLSTAPIDSGNLAGEYTWNRMSRPEPVVLSMPNSDSYYTKCPVCFEELAGFSGKGYSRKQNAKTAYYVHYSRTHKLKG